jgi:hypothetical protein
MYNQCTIGAIEFGIDLIVLFQVEREHVSAAQGKFHLEQNFVVKTPIVRMEPGEVCVSRIMSGGGVKLVINPTPKTKSRKIKHQNKTK